MTTVCALSWAALHYYHSANAMARDGLSGGSAVLLWYGILGTAMMLAAWLVLPVHRMLTNVPPSLNRRWPRFLSPTRTTCLQAHVWLSVLATLLILCHSGLGQAFGRFGLQLSTALLLAFLGTIVTGILGIAAQALLPRQLTKTLTTETPEGELSLGRIAEIPIGHVGAACACWHRQAEQLVKRIGLVAGREFEQVYADAIRPLLKKQSACGLILPGRWKLATRMVSQFQDRAVDREMREAADKLAEIVSERRRLRGQELYYGLLHVWLFAHIPFAVASLILLVVHAWVSLKY